MDCSASVATALTVVSLPARDRKSRRRRPIVAVIPPPIDHASLRLVLPRWPEPEVRRDQLRGSILDLIADAIDAERAGRDCTAELFARIGAISRAAIPA